MNVCYLNKETEIRNGRELCFLLYYFSSIPRVFCVIWNIRYRGGN
jgi:hypothetical protein